MNPKLLRKKWMVMAIAGTVMVIFTLIACKRAQLVLTEENAFDMIVNQMLSEEKSFEIISAQEGVIKTPKRADPSDFLIFPFNVMPTEPENERWGDFANMDSLMSDLYKCGFNTAAFIETKNLQYARRNNLMAILYDDKKPLPMHTDKAEAWIEGIMASITDTLDLQAIHSIFLCDEPKTPDFPMYKIWTDAIKKKQVMPFINLFSNQIEKTVIPDYDEYLSKYLEQCDLPYFSYHYYPFKLAKVINGEVAKVDRVFRSQQFYSALEKMRDKSLETGIPFWNVILSIAHLNLAETTEETLALQVYSALAYGSKGIGYFTFYTSDKGNYRHGAIDRFGYHTPTWDLIRNINLQVHSLVPIYKNLKSVNVFHAETISSNGDVSNFTFSIDSAIAYSGILDNSPLLVGEFENVIDNKPYAIVVNKDIENSVYIKFKFKGYDTKDIVVVNQVNRTPQPFYKDFGSYLSPGYGVLLTVK